MSGRFEIFTTGIDGVKVLKRLPLGDSRGYLERMFCDIDLVEILQDRSVVQINHTLTAECGTVRGLHCQGGVQAETKLISCLVGEVYDVAVDLRPESRTYLHWHAEILSAENHATLVIPEGCAHGFQTLVGNCQLLYLHTAAYDAASEFGINALDPRLGIIWPLDVSTRSPRDSSLPSIPEQSGA